MSGPDPRTPCGDRGGRESRLLLLSRSPPGNWNPERGPESCDGTRLKGDAVVERPARIAGLGRTAVFWREPIARAVARLEGFSVAASRRGLGQHLSSEDRSFLWIIRLGCLKNNIRAFVDRMNHVGASCSLAVSSGNAR